LGAANIVRSLETGGQASGDGKIRPFGFKHTLRRKHSIHGHYKFCLKNKLLFQYYNLLRSVLLDFQKWGVHGLLRARNIKLSVNYIKLK